MGYAQMKYLLILLLVVVSAACANDAHQLASSPSNVTDTRSRKTPARSSMCSWDFANFTYPAHSALGDEESFSLRQGRYESRGDNATSVLTNTSCGDATGDGVEEAIVVIFLATGGTAKTHAVYVFSSENNKPKLLWSFLTGDRAAGGLRQVFAEDGELVVELYGENKEVSSDYSAGEPGVGLCCPAHFTRARYQWRDGGFVRAGVQEVFPNPSGGAPVTMTRYTSSALQ